MGWRGFLRSVGAANRRAARSSARQRHARESAESSIDRTISKLDAEVERDLVKIARFEERMVERPVTHGGLAFDRSTGFWAFKSLADHSGTVHWNFQPRVTSDPVTFVGDRIVNGSRGMAPLALSISRWGIFLAVELSALGAGKKPKKLVSKTDPAQGMVFLRAGPKLHGAIDGNIDRPALGDGIAIIAFPLPRSLVGPLQIEFQFADVPTVVDVRAEDLDGLVARANQAQSLADMARSLLEEKVAPVHQQADAAKKRMARSSSSGCLVLIIIIAMVWAIVAATK